MSISIGLKKDIQTDLTWFWHKKITVNEKYEPLFFISDSVEVVPVILSSQYLFIFCFPHPVPFLSVSFSKIEKARNQGFDTGLKHVWNRFEAHFTLESTMWRASTHPLPISSLSHLFRTRFRADGQNICQNMKRILPTQLWAQWKHCWADLFLYFQLASNWVPTGLKPVWTSAVNYKNWENIFRDTKKTQSKPNLNMQSWRLFFF